MNAIAKPRVRVPAGRSVMPPKASFGGGRALPDHYHAGADNSPLLLRWHPALRETSEDVRSAWRLATARTVDRIQNSGFLTGAIDQSTTQVVGPDGLQLNAKPNAKALGWTEDEANEWARNVETRFSMFCDNPRACDATGKAKFGQLQAQAYRHWLATGEILGVAPLITRPDSQWRTKLKLLPAWRMSSRTLLPDLIQGVRSDIFGAPLSYVMNVKNGMGGFYEQEFPAIDSAGRPLILHIFDGEPEQVRGITPFAPVLKVARQFDQLADATLTTALIQTLFAAMFKSAAKTEDVLDAITTEGEQEKSAFMKMQDTKLSWYEKTDVNLGVHGKILHGFPGDELQFLRAETPNSNYEPFAKFLLREWSRASGITYEEFTGDWAGATFSSAKMGVATNWPRVKYRRNNIVAPLCQKVYMAWLEEDIENGGTPFPDGVDGFLANREAACQGDWRGPMMPQADELKAAVAAKTMQEMGIPDQIIFAMYGGDTDDWYEMRKREQDRKDLLKLRDPGGGNNAMRDALATQPDQGGGDAGNKKQQQGKANG